MSRVKVGERFGRYTVVRHTAPTQDGTGRNRSTVMVECACGSEAVIQERRLKSGESRGCSSKKCFYQNDASNALEPAHAAASRRVFELYRAGGIEAVWEWLGNVGVRDG